MKALITILLIAIPLIISDKDFELIYKFSVEGDFFTTDQLKNVYVIKRHEIIKFDMAGKRLGVYSNNYLGNISYADASDPFRLLLFYKDYNQIVFLDKTLSELGSPIVLDNLETEQVDVVCTSSMGGFWLYNNQLQQLQYFDKDLRLVHHSVNLNSLMKEAVFPSLLIEKNDHLFLNIPNKGVVVFDHYGAFYKTVSILNLATFQAFDNQIIYQKNDSLFKFNYKLMSVASILLPDTTKQLTARLEQNHLFIFNNKSVSSYKLTH